ncbi:MAG TPA: S-layer homology domain-containing protein [Candidatus Olsenella avicola]|nr:S-layer homology domain-containing protein [Candidatus Olsenella avicola]
MSGRTLTQRRGGILAGVVAVLMALAFLVTATPARAATVGTYADGSAGFFEWLGETDAANKVRDALNGTVRNEKNTGRNIGPYQTTSPTSDKSAFNLDNMRDSLEIMEKCNSLRVQNGLSVLYVDPSLMAISQILANYSASTKQHASVFKVGENFTAGSYDFTVSESFNALYNEEKSYWESSACSAARNWFNSYKASHGYNNALNELANTYPTAFKNAGHYLNIINPEYKTTGSACAVGSYYIQEQSFDFGARAKNTYTVARLEELLDQYLDLVGENDPGHLDPSGPFPGDHKLSIQQPSAGGSVSNYIGEYHSPGEDVWVEVAVHPGYVLDYVIVEGVNLVTWSEYANEPGTYAVYFTMPDNDVTVRPVIIKESVPGEEQYNVSVASSSHGRVSVDSSKAGYGWLVNVTATPDAGYKVGSFTVTDASGKSVPTGGKDGEMYFLMPESDVTVKVTFVLDAELSITYDKPAHGRVTVDPSSGVKAGDRVTVALWPDNLYIVKSVKVTNLSTGASVALSGSGATRFFTMPDASVKLEVTFGSMFGGDEEEPEEFPTKFPDVPAGSWYAKPVKWVSDEGIMNGEGDGNFNPGGTLSRASMAQLLWNMYGNPAVDKNLAGTFTDCSTNIWYSSAVAWVYKEGAMTGSGQGTFKPEDTVTREQFATIIWRLEGEPDGRGNVWKYPDSPYISSFSLEAMKWAVGKGIITGSGGNLNSRGVLTRAEAAQMLMNWKG